MAKEGEFREDLLFRINTFEITVPPLRDRKNDLPPLIDHFVRRGRPQTPPRAETIDDEALGLLLAHDWPGNIRELANVIEHALVLCDDLPVTAEHLPGRFRNLVPVTPAKRQTEGATVARSPTATPAADRPKTLRAMELEAILEGLERNGGNKPKTAEELGVSLKTLYNKLHQLQQEGLVARPA
jgi:two-component system NtrC family response regulator